MTVAAALGLALCAAARLWPGRWTRYAGRLISVILLADATTFVVVPVVQQRWRVGTSLPLALCDVALVVAALACWWPEQTLLVELTYFWGLAGTLQAVATPDLEGYFPHLSFFEYVVGHVGIVIAALFLVVGVRQRPRRNAVARVFAITLAYTAVIGGFDAIFHTDYMFLRTKPASWTLLSVLGPWPWYIASAAGVALVLLVALDLPLRLTTDKGRTSMVSNRTLCRSSPPSSASP